MFTKERADGAFVRGRIIVPAATEAGAVNESLACRCAPLGVIGMLVDGKDVRPVHVARGMFRRDFVLLAAGHRSAPVREGRATPS